MTIASRTIRVWTLGFMLGAILSGSPPGHTMPASNGFPQYPFFTPRTATAVLTAAPASAASSGRDLKTIRVCKLVTPQEVASLAGGKVKQDPLGSNTETSALCAYHVEFPNGDYQQYRILLQPTKLVEELIKCCAADLGQPVSGLGDVAFLEREKGSDLLRLVVVVKNDFALELTATSAGKIPVSEKVVRRLAETTLARLKR